MEYLIYKSTALVAPGSVACRDILTVSQRKNADLGLTGFLHAEEGLFIQYLEGPPVALWALYQRLHRDPRHRHLVLLGRGELQKRRFMDWRLGYSDLEVLSFSDFLEEVTTAPQDKPASGPDAILFLMAASARIDLGIADPPQCAWH